LTKKLNLVDWKPLLPSGAVCNIRLNAEISEIVKRQNELRRAIDAMVADLKKKNSNGE
jgi:hypothetical protein